MDKFGLESAKKIGATDYDFSRDGGAAGEIALSPAYSVPKGAIVTGGYIKVDTAVTSGDAATIAVHLENAEDVLEETAIASFSAGALIPIVTTAFVTANHGGFKVTIGTAALTGGAFTIFAEYIETR